LSRWFVPRHFQLGESVIWKYESVMTPSGNTAPFGSMYRTVSPSYPSVSVCSS
jgi:hypothetical protein